MTVIEKDQLKQLNDRFDKIEESVAQIRDAILGNEYNEKAAYKTRIESLEDFKAKVEIKILKAQIWGTAIGFILCALLEFLFKYSAIVQSFKK